MENGLEWEGRNSQKQGMTDRGDKERINYGKRLESGSGIMSFAVEVVERAPNTYQTILRLNNTNAINPEKKEFFIL